MPTAVYRRVPEGYIAWVDDLPGANTQGETLEDARRNLREAIALIEGDVMPTTSNVLCGCGRFMRCLKNSVTVEELHSDGTPYRLWDADLYTCEDCAAEVITGFAKAPLVEAWQRDYATQRDRLDPVYLGRCRPEKEHHDD